MVLSGPEDSTIVILSVKCIIPTDTRRPDNVSSVLLERSSDLRASLGDVSPWTEE